MAGASLKVKAKGAGNPKGPGIRVIEVIAPKVKIDPENFEDVAHAERILPINFIVWGLQGDVGRRTQQNVFIR